DTPWIGYWSPPASPRASMRATSCDRTYTPAPPADSSFLAGVGGSVDSHEAIDPGATSLFAMAPAGCPQTIGHNVTVPSSHEAPRRRPAYSRSGSPRGP